MEPHSARTYRQMAQHISKSGSGENENKGEYPSSYQILPERQTRQPSHGTDFKPWMETRHYPHSRLASQSSYQPNRPLNLAFASLFDQQPPSPAANNRHPRTGTMPRREDDPHDSHVSSEFLLARVRIMNKKNPQPDDDQLLHSLAKVQDPEDKDKESAFDEQMRGRIETWLDGVEEFVPLKRATPKDFRSRLRKKGEKERFGRPTPFRGLFYKKRMPLLNSRYFYFFSQ